MNILLYIYVFIMLWTFFTSPPDGESSGFSVAFNVFVAVIWPVYWAAVIFVAVYWGIAKQKYAQRSSTPAGPKKNQGGYYDMDFTALFVVLITIGVVVGILVSYVAPYLWGFLKPIIHSLTA